MKILLISPPFKCFTGLYSSGFPLGLSILASIAAQEGVEAYVYEVDRAFPADSLNLADEHSQLDKYTASVNDMRHPAWEELKKTLALFKPDAVGITAYTTTFASALQTARACKTYNPEIITILGGPHPTARPYDCFKSDCVDFIVAGEGEIPFRQLLKYLDRRQAGVDSIPGLGYRQDSRITINPKPDFIRDLDSIPMPDRGLLLHRDRYGCDDMGLLIASRGCPFGCTYCFHFFGKTSRRRSVDNVIREIEAVIAGCGATHFAFRDDTMTLNSKWVAQFCRQLKKRRPGITWECVTRADALDEKLLDAMISAGCNVVKIGVESGSPDILARTAKNLSKDVLIKTARLLNNRRIFWCGYFMYGLPFETEEDLLETYKFMRSLKPDYAALCLYQVSPTTEIYEYGAEKGIYHKAPALGHFFAVNPKDYYMVNPEQRCLHIENGRFKQLERFLAKGFDDYNSSLGRVLKRGWMRRSIYFKDILLLFKEMRLAFKWIIRNKLQK